MRAGIKYATTLSLLLSSGFVAAEAQRMAEGHTAYEAGCARCHEDGSEGAPVTSNADDWSERSDLWEGVLFEHARKGYINMPAKGGEESISDYDVNAAAEYMLTITHPEMPED